MFKRVANAQQAGSFPNTATIQEVDNEMLYVEENVNDILKRQENKYKGWLCWAGQESLMIAANGDVFVATCRNKKLGNIYDDFEIPTEPIVCQKNWCVCAADLNTSKAKDANIAKKLRVNNGTGKKFAE